MTSRRPSMRALVLFLAAAGTAAASAPTGRDLFVRSWEPWDPRAAKGGDGLGPMYNATSCVSCHSQGGPGGAGAKDRNVKLTATRTSPEFVVEHRFTTLAARWTGMPG